MQDFGPRSFRIGVIGATGYVGVPYRREIRESGLAEITALCARRREPLEAAARLDGAELATGDWRRVVDHPEIDLVIVATPDALHFEAAMACARAGKHLFCEKPVGMDAAEAREIKNAYSARPQLAHYVPYWTRYVEVFARARELVRRGELGTIRLVIYRWYNPRPADMPLTWRDDPRLSAAGSIADVGSHAYDTVRWTIGEGASRVLAHADTLTSAKAKLGAINLTEALDWGRRGRLEDVETSRGGTPDYAGVHWEFESGAVGTLTLSHTSFLRKGLAPEMELHGDEASLAVDRVNGQLTMARPDREPSVIARLPDRGFGNRFAKYVFPALNRYREGDRAAGHPDLEDGWRTQIFTDAIVRSAKSGNWVALEEIDDG